MYLKERKKKKKGHKDWKRTNEIIFIFFNNNGARIIQIYSYYAFKLRDQGEERKNIFFTPVFQVI